MGFQNGCFSSEMSMTKGSPSKKHTCSGSSKILMEQNHKGKRLGTFPFLPPWGEEELSMFSMKPRWGTPGLTFPGHCILHSGQEGGFIFLYCCFWLFNTAIQGRRRESSQHVLIGGATRKKIEQCSWRVCPAEVQGSRTSVESMLSVPGLSAISGPWGFLTLWAQLPSSGKEQQPGMNQFKGL